VFLSGVGIGGSVRGYPLTTSASFTASRSVPPGPGRWRCPPANALPQTRERVDPRRKTIGARDRPPNEPRRAHRRHHIGHQPGVRTRLDEGLHGGHVAPHRQRRVLLAQWFCEHREADDTSAASNCRRTTLDPRNSFHVDATLFGGMLDASTRYVASGSSGATALHGDTVTHNRDDRRRQGWRRPGCRTPTTPDRPRRVRVTRPNIPPSTIRYSRVDGTGTRPIIAVGRRSVSATRSLRTRRVMN
jgi:hypothetical protein